MDGSVTSWIGRGLLLLLLVVLTTLYSVGRQRVTLADEPRRLRPFFFYSGVVMTAIVLISPFDALVSTYFTARATQQLFLTEIIPFCLLASDPYPILVAGMPNQTAIRFNQWHTENIWLKRFTSPGIVWGAFVSLFWFWHDAEVLQIVNANSWLHVIEVLSLLLVSSLYWWHIAAARPHLHRPMSAPVRLAYAFIGILPVKLTGIIMLFGQETRVGGYVEGASGRLMLNFGGVQIADNSMGAIIIWVIGGVMYALATLYLGNRLLGKEENKPLLPVNPIERDDLWVIPGVGSGRTRTNR